MAKLILRRLFSMIVTMVVVSIVVFLFTELAPGDVARNILGIDAQPEQVAAFRRQLGLDQPLPMRYLDWLVGNDWRAQHLTGMPLTRVNNESTGFWDWWAVAPDGVLTRWNMVDGKLVAYYRGADGKETSGPAGDVWHPDAQGQMVFWGVDTANRAVLWRQGAAVSRSGPLSSGRLMTGEAGGVAYIPLARGMVRGDPGLSTHTNRPVATILFPCLVNSIILAALAFTVVMPLAVVLGLVAGVAEGTALDRLLSVGGLVTTSSPNFATGIFLILIFGIWLKVLPGATVFSTQNAILAQPTMMVLPVVTLTLIELGYVLRITRASVVEVMNTPYIRTAFLKGMPYRRVVFKHVFRNALIAPITVITLHINWLMGGIVVVEALFGYPGLGTYLLQSALYKDVTAIEAGAMVMVGLAVGTQLVADIIYAYLNPRIRYS